MVVINEVGATTNGSANGTSHAPQVDEEATWSENGVKVAGSKRWGTDLGSFNFPSGIYVDDDETLYVTDYSNDRVVEWKAGAKTGTVVVGAGGLEDRTHRLRHPTDILVEKATDSFIVNDEGHRRVVRCPRSNGLILETIISNIDGYGITMDKDGLLYVCNHKKHEVRRFKIGESEGTLVAGGNGKGARLDQLSLPTFISVDNEYNVYVSDWANHRVVKWKKGAKQGVIVAGGTGNRPDLMPLLGPFGLIVDPVVGTIFVADWEKHRVMRWNQGDKEGTIIAGVGGKGDGANQLCHPMSLAFDTHGNLYVTDYSNQRVQKYNINTFQNL